MASLPALSENKIRDWTDSRSFSRGRNYYNSGAVRHPRKEEDTLKGECWGSAMRPYRIEITLSKDGIAGGICSCPVGGGGCCKHAVALLLTWLHEPEAFTEVVSQKRSLADRSKEELIDLIGKMIDRHPELEALLEMPVPTSGRQVDPAVIRRLVSDALEDEDYEYEWGYHHVDTSNLMNVASQGDEYAAAQDWSNAAVVYKTVAEEILDSYEQLYDEEGEYLSVVGECADGLGNCLPHVEDTIERRQLLEALFAIYRWDIEFGGVGAGDDAYVALLENTTADDRRLVAEWVQQELADRARDESFTSNWRQQAYGAFLLRLSEDELDDETYLSICRKTGRTQDLVGRLLQLGRLEEAAAEARAATDWELTQLADIFQEAGHGDVVAEIIEKRPVESDLRPQKWLLQYRRAAGDLARALEIAQEIFLREQHLENFKIVRELAEKAGTLDEVIRPIIRRLVAKKEYDLLTRIYLAAGEIDLALEALAQFELRGSRAYYYGHESLRLEVAAAAEEERPEASLDIYRQTVTALIAARGRDNYREAAGYLLRMQNLYRQLDKENEFTELVLQLRNENRTLRAMKDEFNRAGLPPAGK